MEKPKKRITKAKLKLKKEFPSLTEENIETVFKDNFDKIDLDDIDYNTFLNKKELLNRKFITEHEDDYVNLYPSLDDPQFNIKITQKKGI